MDDGYPHDLEERFTCDFREPGGRSALRAGRRIHPCPSCKRPNQLTAKDKSLGYQCDRCADRDEGGGY